MKIKSKAKCDVCHGTGEIRPKNKKDERRFNCTQCNGTGELQHYEMIFWSYDQFPFVLAGAGFVQDNGTAWLPSYESSFRPLKVMSLTDGQKFKDRLDALKQERDTVLESLEKGWQIRLDAMAPWARPWAKK